MVGEIHDGYQETSAKIASRFAWDHIFKGLNKFGQQSDLYQRCKDYRK